MLCLSIKNQTGVSLILNDGRIIRIERGHGQTVKIDAPRDVQIVRDGAKKQERT